MALLYYQLFFVQDSKKNVGYLGRLLQMVLTPRVFHNWMIMRSGTPGVAAKSAAISGVPGFATAFKCPTFGTGVAGLRKWY